jgi:hypothetical protein
MDLSSRSAHIAASWSATTQASEGSYYNYKPGTESAYILVAMMDIVGQHAQEPDGAEFLGLARKMHGQLVVAAKLSSPMMAAIRTDIIAVGERRGRRRRQRLAWREDYLLEIEQRWRSIPANERLLLHINRTRTDLLILDVRCGSTVVTNSQWADGQQETDLIIIGNRIVMNARGSECNSAPMATVSVRHALSRRYRRGPPARWAYE